jgi:hypothetical protein
LSYGDSDVPGDDPVCFVDFDDNGKVAVTHRVPTTFVVYLARALRRWAVCPSCAREIDLRAAAPQATIVAGDGFTFFAGFTGDGPALAAELNAPSGIGVDFEGRVLIPEWHGQRVRRLDQGLPPDLGAADRAAAARSAWPHAAALPRGSGRRFGR